MTDAPTPAPEPAAGPNVLFREVPAPSPLRLVFRIVTIVLILVIGGFVALAAFVWTGLSGFSLAGSNYHKAATKALRGHLEPGETILTDEQSPQRFSEPINPHGGSYVIHIFTRKPVPGRKDRILEHRVEVSRGFFFMDATVRPGPTDLSDDPFFAK